jgi:hypothetical protein
LFQGENEFFENIMQKKFTVRSYSLQMVAALTAQPKLRLAGKLLHGLDSELRAKLGQKAGVPVPKHCCLSFPNTSLI